MAEKKVSDLETGLAREPFMASLATKLAQSLEEVIGLDEAQGFISIVGSRMGAEIGSEYCKGLSTDRVPRARLAEVLVDLKARIGGDFHVVRESENEIVLGNRACPFGDAVRGRPSLCMMTSNVFGHIAAQSAGYARVSVDESIATGHAGCLISIRFDSESGSDGREYYRLESAKG